MRKRYFPIGNVRCGRGVNQSFVSRSGNETSSAEDYEAMRAYYADRLRQTLRESAESAAAAGLTEEKLAELLADES